MTPDEAWKILDEWDVQAFHVQTTRFQRAAQRRDLLFQQLACLFCGRVNPGRYGRAVHLHLDTDLAKVLRG